MSGRDVSQLVFVGLFFLAINSYAADPSEPPSVGGIGAPPDTCAKLEKESDDWITQQYPNHKENIGRVTVRKSYPIRYPYQAAKWSQGFVFLLVRIDENGKPEGYRNMRVLVNTGHPQLASMAAYTIQNWEFDVAKVTERKFPVELLVPIVYCIPGKPL